MKLRHLLGLVLCLPLAACGSGSAASPTAQATVATSPSTIELQRGPDDIGCDAVDPGYRSATIHIDPESDIYLEIFHPAWDGTKNRVNVDVWAEVDPLSPGSPGTEPVEPLPAGTKLAVYWTSGFTADGDTPVIRGARGEEVARDGSKIDQEFTDRTGYVTCGGRDALYVYEHSPQ